MFEFMKLVNSRSGRVQEMGEWAGWRVHFTI